MKTVIRKLTLVAVSSMVINCAIHVIVKMKNCVIASGTKIKNTSKGVTQRVKQGMLM